MAMRWVGLVVSGSPERVQVRKDESRYGRMSAGAEGYVPLRL